MGHGKAIDGLTAGQLKELLAIYAKNWLAMDGVWFQSVEERFGMDEAMLHDANAWRRFTVVEARRIKAFLGLPEQAGLDGLERALALRFYANINRDEARWEDGALCYRTLECRVQQARLRKGMPLHPCKGVGLIEYSGFAAEIDRRIVTECVSCHPDVTDPSCNCAWRFTLE
ncbi:MAG: DUF6125 family protein [Acidobacteriota bacterium]|jgi:hypothetical protein|nr:DUF6125 family protein [Acidobacteriota bacterium]